MEFSIAHVTYKRGPRLKLSFELSQFELTRQDFTSGTNIKDSIHAQAQQQNESANPKHSRLLPIPIVLLRKLPVTGNANHCSTLYRRCGAN